MRWIYALGICVFLGAILFVAQYPAFPTEEAYVAPAQEVRILPAAVALAPTLSSTTTRAATSSPERVSTTTTQQKQEKLYIEPKKENPETRSVVRVEDPYTSPALSFDTVNISTRAALVNIFCVPSGGSLSPISGSGVFIDSRGVILTNAHVAQYVLLAQSGLVDLACSIRTGAPAAPSYKVSVLAFPRVWAIEHAEDAKTRSRLGTGEHDWALLRAFPMNNSSSQLSVYALDIDTRPAIGFVDDQVLGAGYPAEFVGGTIAQTQLFPASSVTRIDELFTFGSTTVDVFSIGSLIAAQAGSSGGAVTNKWGKLIGIITTTSEGVSTANRSLRALTLSYIDADLQQQVGRNLKDFLAQNLDDLSENFAQTTLPSLANILLAPLAR